jgi:hypothetical protein
LLLRRSGARGTPRLLKSLGWVHTIIYEIFEPAVLGASSVWNIQRLSGRSGALGLVAQAARYAKKPGVDRGSIFLADLAVHADVLSNPATSDFSNQLERKRFQVEREIGVK